MNSLVLSSFSLFFFFFWLFLVEMESPSELVIWIHVVKTPLFFTHSRNVVF